MKYFAPKEKGRRLELRFAKMLRESGLDSDAKRMPRSGGFEGLKSDIWTHLPWQFELKNQEKIAFWDWWTQAEAQKRPNRPPVLVFTSNYRPIIVALEAGEFLNLLKELEDYRDEQRKNTRHA